MASIKLPHFTAGRFLMGAALLAGASFYLGWKWSPDPYADTLTRDLWGATP